MPAPGPRRGRDRVVLDGRGWARAARLGRGAVARRLADAPRRGRGPAAQRAGRRPTGGLARPGALPRPTAGDRAGLHGHGPAPRRRRAGRLPPALPQRPAGLARLALHPPRHGPGPGRHRPARRGRGHPGGRRGRPARAAPAGPLPGGHPRPGPPRRPARGPGRGPGGSRRRLRPHHLRGGGRAHGRGQRAGAHARAHHRHRAGDRQGAVRPRPGPGRVAAGPGAGGQRRHPGAAGQAAGMSPGVLYRLEGVAQAYAGRTVLDVERLDVHAGEVLCLVGPTGAGKSTLLRLLAGLERPAAGRLSFGRHRLDEGALPLGVQRTLTLVFQRPLLLAGTVRANVEYGLRLRRAPNRAARAQAALERLGLAALASRTARTLSGGEAQLVALARALALEPEVLLLDEPTAHLDPARVALVEGVLQEVHRRGTATVVWATHNLFQARRVAGRVALLLDGRLVEAAPAEAFFTAPQDPRTAAFVRGEMVC